VDDEPLMGTSIPAARGVLFDRLYAARALAGVQRAYGEPDAYEDPEVVALLGTRAPEEEPAAMGAGRKDETYELEVGIKVHKRDGTAREVDVRAYELADVVVDEVEGTGDYTLNQSVMWAFVTSVTGDRARPAEGGGWVIFLTVLITCRARINRRTA